MERRGVSKTRGTEGKLKRLEVGEKAEAESKVDRE